VPYCQKYTPTDCDFAHWVVPKRYLKLTSFTSKVYCEYLQPT